MPTFAPLARATVAKARRLFEQEAKSAREIAQRLNISASTVTRYVKKEGWRAPGAAPATLKPPRTAKTRRPRQAPRPAVARNLASSSAERAAPDAAGAATFAERIAAMTGSLVDAAEIQVADIARRLADASPDAAGREREARAFAVIARTLREIMALEAALAPGWSSAPQIEAGDDDLERLVDDYRAQLARILGGLRAGPDESGSGDPGHAGPAPEGAGAELGVPGKE